MPHPKDISYCEVCMEAIESNDGWSYTCDLCGREGFCRKCAGVGNHDCDEPPFWILAFNSPEEEEPPADGPQKDK